MKQNILWRIKISKYDYKGKERYLAILKSFQFGMEWEYSFNEPTLSRLLNKIKSEICPNIKLSKKVI
jgi:hypothetical protein